MEREFYPLDQAAEKLKMPINDLIHVAAWTWGGRSIPIYILTAPFDQSSIHVDKDGALDEYPISSTTKIMKLSDQCLQEIEAGRHDVEVSFDRRPFYEFDSHEVDDPLFALLTNPEPRATNGYWHIGLRRRNVEYPLLYEFRPRRLFDSSYPDPIKIGECKMVVLADDLERFQQSKAGITEQQPLTENDSAEPLAYLDESHLAYSKELGIAIQVWQAVLESNPARPKQGSRKQLLSAWINQHHPELTESAKERIVTLLNPDKNGGHRAQNKKPTHVEKPCTARFLDNLPIPGGLKGGKCSICKSAF